MQCNSCGTKNLDYARFCSHCGKRLEQERQTPPASSIPVPREQVSNERAPAEEITVRKSASAERDRDSLTLLPTLPPALSPASIPSPGEHSSGAVPDRISVPDQQSFTRQLNVSASAFPIQQASSSVRFNPPSDQRPSLHGEVPLTRPAVSISAFAHSVTASLVQTTGSRPPKGFREKLPRHWRIIALIVIVILLVGGSAAFLVSWLSTVLPAATATVTITPANQHLTKTYSISAVTGTPNASNHEVQARLLSFTTPEQSQTVQATGKGHQNATWARGQVTITASAGTVPASNLHITSSSGVNVVISVLNPVSSGSQTFDARAENAGSGGNIRAYDINGYYNLVSNPNVVFYLQNTQAFTGGEDAQDYLFVQQSDIDKAATALTASLTSDAKAAIQQQLRTNEQFVSTPKYTPAIKANHKANDRSDDVTVTVTVTGEAEVYDSQATRSVAADWLRSDAVSQLGTHYALVGDVIMGTPQVATTGQSSTVIVNVSAEGIWVYQFGNTQKQEIANSIAGKSLADADDLLRKQTRIQKFVVTTAGGWGTALPTSPGNIKFIVLPVSGLRAVSTS